MWLNQSPTNRQNPQMNIQIPFLYTVASPASIVPTCPMLWDELCPSKVTSSPNLQYQNVNLFRGRVFTEGTKLK